ncbi:MAG TPA: thioredoxin family protein [Jatrophihabitantaceae bacterium]|nr:thioredoxin family protein [Jatrophihabitantaceae bacterium]
MSDSSRSDGGQAQSAPAEVEVLVVPDCPNRSGAEQLVRAAIAEAGLGRIEPRTRVVQTDEDAARLGFSGSPSFRIDGRDPFGPAGSPSMACRLYLTAAGLRGLPELSALTAALGRSRSR